MEQDDFCNEKGKRRDSKIIVAFQLVSMVTHTADKQKEIQRPRERGYSLYTKQSQPSAEIKQAA